MNILLTIEQFNILKQAIKGSLLEDPPIDNIEQLENAYSVLESVEKNRSHKQDYDSDGVTNLFAKNYCS
tara:strand:+ start:321 stop:527 length:207 start_codon:yes stop_codon:yes gene_type:complete